jgi:hypothetical protein
MSDTITDIVNKLPEPDERGFMSVIDKDVVDGVTEAILEKAPGSLVEVVDMLKEPGEGDDYKAHYALHCVAIDVGKGRKKQRKMVAGTIAGCLGEDYPTGVKKYLIRELQVVGGKEVIAALEKCSGDKDLAEPARQALAAIKHTV